MKLKLTEQSLACIILTIFSFSQELSAQEKIFIEQGKINFISNAPLEIIKASSDQMKMVIDPATNQFAFSVTMTTFKGFKTGMQLEHFNEKFMESDKYPNAKFTGKIIEKVDYKTDGVYEVRAKGDLDIHGVKQTRIIKSKITVKNGAITITSDFNVPLPDHNISIPRIISEKIATEINIKVFASTNQDE